MRTLGPALQPGDVVLDLACGDGGFADFLPEQRYVGVDASAEMVAAGRGRGRDVVQADLNEYTPPQPVEATTIFRALYYAADRRVLLTRIAGYTTRKLVFDLNPRQYRLADVRAGPRGGRLRPAGHAAVLRSADESAHARASAARAQRPARVGDPPLPVHAHLLGLVRKNRYVELDPELAPVAAASGSSSRG